MTLEDKAKALAVECRKVVQNALLVWEWRDAEEEFCRVILAGLEELYGKYVREAGGTSHR